MNRSLRVPQIPEPSFLLISPIGEVSRDVCDKIGEKIGPFFGCQVKIESLLPDIEFAFDVNRNQYHSTPILEALEKKAPVHCVKLLAVTLEDLFIPILTHVYGEAQLDGKACIVSTYRLDTDFRSDRSVIMDRVIKESIHELGHTFNLRHCPDSDCLMHYCRSPEDVSLKSDQFCRYCTIFLSDAVKQLSLQIDSPGSPR